MRGLVVAPEPPAAEAGAAVLRRGGNAADAAAAAAFAQCVTNPLFCGLGGSAIGLVRRGSGGPVRVLDASVTVGSIPPPRAWEDGFAGRTETIGRYVVRDESNQIGYRSVMVPGFVRGVHALSAGFGSGRVAWRDLLAPAIRLAEDGFDVYPYIANHWADTEDRPGYPGLARKFACTPECARVFLRPGGAPYRAGDRLVQADLARTLRRIADEGPDEFYAGATGRRIAEDVAAAGGLFTAADLREYRPLEYAPLEGRYQDWRIAAVPPPGSGAQLIEMLRLAEAMELGRLRHNGPEYVDLAARLMIATFVEHARLKGDPPYTVVAPALDRLLSDGHVRALADALRRARPAGEAPAAAAPGTTHVCVADGDGTVVSLTHTIGSLGASGVVVPGTGILLNNFLGHFHPLPGHPDSIVPGKRGGGGCPALVLDARGRLRIAIGAPGGSRLISAVFQVLLNLLARALPAQAAVSALRFHAEEPGLVFAEPELVEGAAGALRAQGYRIERSTYMSRVQAIVVDEDGVMHAGADPRGGMGVGAVEA